MRIACPICESVYQVPDALIGAGRLLRCAKCSHEWLVTGLAEPEPAASAPPVPAERPPSGPMLRRPPQVADPPLMAPEDQPLSRMAQVVLWAAWIGSGLLLGALGVGAWVYRGPISEAWPPAARLYLLLGAPQAGGGGAGGTG